MFSCFWSSLPCQEPGRSLIKTTVSLNLRRGRASPVLATGQGKPCTCDGTGQALYLRRNRASPVLATRQGKPCTCDGTGQAQGRAGTCDIIGHDWNLGIEHSRRKWSRVIRGGGPSTFTYNQWVKSNHFWAYTWKQYWHIWFPAVSCCQKHFH